MVWWFRGDFVDAFTVMRERMTVAVAAGVLAFTLLHLLNEPLRWWVLLRGQQAQATLPRIYHAMTTTALVSYTLPARLGVPIRILMAKRVLGLEYATASAVLLLDSVYSYGVWAVAALIGGAVVFPDSGQLAVGGALAVIGVGTVGLLLAVRVEWARWARSPWMKRFAAGMQLMSLRVGVCNSLLLALDILLYGVRHRLILQGLGVECSLLTVTLIVAISILAGFLSLMPLGLGGYDLSLAFLLASIGVPRELAVTVPLINRIVTISTGVVMGAMSASYLGVKPRRDMAAAETTLEDGES